MMRWILNNTFKLLILLLITINQSCSLIKSQSPDDPIMAKTDLGTLTLSQVEAMIPNNMKGLDSVQFVQSYVDRWIHNQLLLENAMEYVDKESLHSINQMVADYHTTLLVHKYQQMYIERELDTLIPSAQIEEHYSKFGNNFLLDSAAVRAVYVKVPIKFSDKNKLRRMIRANNQADSAQLAELGAKALIFTDGTKWQYLNRVMTQIPEGAISNPIAFAKSGRYFETQDDTCFYILVIREFRDVNEQAPLVFAKNRIREILINHRKTDLIKNLEIQIYIDAVNKQRFTNYVN